MMAFLGPLPEDRQITYSIADPTTVRLYLAASLGINVQPLSGVNIGLGARSFHGQLTPDGGFRIPLVNRNTELYLNTRLSLETVVSWLTAS